MDLAHQSCLSELEKIAIAIPMGPTLGKNIGKAHGWGSTKGGFSTTYRSAGMGSAKPGVPKPLPGVKSNHATKVRNVTPPRNAEANNMAELRRGLSNIETKQ